MKRLNKAQRRAAELARIQDVMRMHDSAYFISHLAHPFEMVPDIRTGNIVGISFTPKGEVVFTLELADGDTITLSKAFVYTTEDEAKSHIPAHA